MNRRKFIAGGVLTSGVLLSQPRNLLAWRLRRALDANRLDAAAEILSKATTEGQLHAASLFVQQGDATFSRAFGAARSPQDIFLLASISKPISVAALMTLYDQDEFKLDDPVKRYIPEFKGDGREKVTLRQLLTHASGLPDQLANNQKMRQQHATLSQFVDAAIRTPLKFQPGSKYSYSSMAILLATEIARRISGVGILEFVNQAVFKRLGMKRSALGMGPFKLDQLIRCQVVSANPESGSGDASAKNWDWNSAYWRAFGAPWGGAHASAPDVAKFLSEFLHHQGRMLKPETAALMIRNHNRAGLTPRGLGFGVGQRAGSPGCSERTFGHSGATGTLAWADPKTDTMCIVLTTLPGRAANPHPRQLASRQVALAVE